MPRKCLIIANPISGLGRARRNAPKLEAGLRKLGFDVELHWTKAAGDARAAAENASPDGVSAILSVGGDGTLNEIVNGIGDKGIPVTIFPTGTGNVLKKEYGIPFSVGRVCRMIDRGRTLQLDVGRLDNGRRFVLFAGIGFDAAVARTMAERRAGRIWLASYVVPMIRMLSTYRFPAMQVIVDGEVIPNVTTALVCNVRSYGGPFKFTNDADPTDGAFDLCLMQGRRRRDIVRYFWGAVTRRLSFYKDVIYRRGSRIEFAAENALPVQTDGDYIGTAPKCIELLPGRLPVIVP